MSIIDALILGIVQGLTEFLPISSSGHLVLARELLNLGQSKSIAFEVFVHFGTFISVILIFWKDIKQILNVFIKGILNPLKIKILFKENDDFRLAIFILIGSVPAGLVGIMFDKEIEMLFGDPKFVSVMLLITGAIIYITKFANPREESKVGFWSSILIGIAQSIAIIPGISRSGITISTGLFSGVSRVNSAKFSFLLSLPVILGATILKTAEVFSDPNLLDDIFVLIIGTISAAVSGYLAIRLVINLLMHKKFNWFSFYCFVVAIIGILLIG